MSIAEVSELAAIIRCRGWKSVLRLAKRPEVERSELSWWLEMAPNNEAIYYIDKEEHNVSDIDAFYDYLVGMAKESDNKTGESK